MTSATRLQLACTTLLLLVGASGCTDSSDRSGSRAGPGGSAPKVASGVTPDEPTMPVGSAVTTPEQAIAGFRRAWQREISKHLDPAHAKHADQLAQLINRSDSPSAEQQEVRVFYGTIESSLRNDDAAARQRVLYGDPFRLDQSGRAWLVRFPVPTDMPMSGSAVEALVEPVKGGVLFAWIAK